MSKLPAFQFYPADWRKDIGVQSLSFHDRGVWFEILCLMHESEERGKLVLKGRSMPKDLLSRILGLDKRVLDQTLDRLKDVGVVSEDPVSGALMNRRMVRDEHDRSLNRARQDRYRQNHSPPAELALHNGTSNGHVTAMSQRSSSSSSTSPTKDSAKAGGEAPPRNLDPVERRIWKDGVDLLVKSGVKEEQARTLLGQMARDHGKLVLAECIAATQAENPAHPKTYLIGALRKRERQSLSMKVGKQQEADADPAVKCKTCFDVGFMRRWPDESKPLESVKELCPDCSTKK